MVRFLRHYRVGGVGIFGDAAVPASLCAPRPPRPMQPAQTLFRRSRATWMRSAAARRASSPVGWNAFVISGDPIYLEDHHTYSGGSNLTMTSGAPFKAGIFTQVTVTPGAGYRLPVWRGARPISPISSRQLGLLPTGGTDPAAATVIGPMHGARD